MSKLRRSVEVFDTDGKHKLVLKLQVLDKLFTVVKLYRSDTTYDEALADAEERLSKMISEGTGDVNKKVAYLMDGYAKTTEEDS